MNRNRSVNAYIYKLTALTTAIIFAFLLSISYAKLSAIGNVDPRAHRVAHAMDFLNLDYQHTKNGPTYGYGKYEYSHLHNLMASGQDVEFDVSIHNNKLYICHTNNSSCHDELRTFLKNHANNYNDMVIETKGFEKIGRRVNVKALTDFKNITSPYRRKIEIESFNEDDINFLKNVNYKNRSLILANKAYNFSRALTNRWSRKGISTLLLTAKTAKSDLSNLKRNWKGKRLGFWTVDWDQDETIFNEIYKENLKTKNFRDIYYMTNYGHNSVSDRASFILNMIKNKWRDSYMIELLSYKNGIIVKSKTEFNKWLNDWNNAEAKHNYSYYQKRVYAKVLKNAGLWNYNIKVLLNKFKFNKVGNYFQEYYFYNNVERNFVNFRKSQISGIINHKSGSKWAKRAASNRVFSKYRKWWNKDYFLNLQKNIEGKNLYYLRSHNV